MKRKNQSERNLRKARKEGHRSAQVKRKGQEGDEDRGKTKKYNKSC